ncbi:MAG: DUF2318 domain-containing protein [Clostridia bacterium]|nr:DUF2318 domain-containing protein [Clostridia bacterium]
MKKIIFLIIALILITLLVSAYGSETVPSGRKQETAGLTVDITDLTEEPMFIDAEADGIAMQLIAVRAGDEVRLAFNTCQACQGSPWAWFEYLGDDVLQCQNCHQTFKTEIVGTEEAIGCCPITITDFNVEGNLLTVPETVLTDNAFRFKNWKQVGQ